MIDFNKCRDQILSLTNDWGVEVMEATVAELHEVYEHVSGLVKGGEKGLGGLAYSDLHAAQILETMIRFELEIRAAGEEAPGMPYDPAQSAAEIRRMQARRRSRSDSNPN